MTDRVWHPYSLGRERIADAIEMILIARGIDREQLAREPSMFSIINSNSPLRLDGPMLQGMTEMALHAQPIVMTPFTLSGAMAPATIAGALAEQNAEALAGITYMQVVAPGCPVMYGGFTSNVDMKTGAPAFGTPEYTRAAMAGGQLARRYKIPYRSSNACAANAVDAQAAYESEMSIWGAVMGHANMIMHGAGWMEGGLVANLREADPRRRDPAGHGRVHAAHRGRMTILWRLTPSPRSAPAGISSASAIRWSATRPPSTRRSCRTGAISKPGARPARSPPTSGPMRSGSSSWSITSSRRWIPPRTRR